MSSYFQFCLYESVFVVLLGLTQKCLHIRLILSVCRLFIVWCLRGSWLLVTIQALLGFTIVEHFTKVLFFLIISFHVLFQLVSLPLLSPVNLFPLHHPSSVFISQYLDCFPFPNSHHACLCSNENLVCSLQNKFAPLTHVSNPALSLQPSDW